MLLVETFMFLFKPVNLYNMETQIETRLKKSLSLVEKKFKDDDIALQFEKSNKEFKELIIKGIVRERGNNLLSISDIESIPKVIFNT